MSVAAPLNRNKTTQTLIMPLSADTLYWRVYVYCDDFLKMQTVIPLKFHDITARYFAGLWKDCFQNKINPNRRKYCFPIGYTIIPNNMLFEINKYIDQEIRMFLYDQKLIDLDEKLAFVMRLGQLAIQAKEIILLSKSDPDQVDVTLNDNEDQIINASTFVA